MELNQQNSPWIRGKFLGKGSYGTVSLGFRGYGEGENAFAVKSAPKGCIYSIQALENEIDILRFISSSSPFIVDYYGDSETTSSKELFIEYLPGGDVAGKGMKVADVELIRSYTWCLVSALREVHANGIVHCDVKGSNVLVAGVGPSENRVAKLADFGSAKRVGDGQDEVMPRGSPLWWAPEVVRGEAQGCESDVWALGCTVIEMFTGLPAWQDNGAHTLYKIGYCNELPEFPARLPELASDFLGKCLVREPGQRWSCDQLLEHPFIVSVAGGVFWEISPRSVFDLGEWVGFSDDEGDVSEGEIGDEEDRVLARGRIGELGGGVGVFWESDGWVEVRNVREECCELCEGGEEIVGSRLGVNSEIHSEKEAEEDVDDPAWIKLSTEINEMEIEVVVSGRDDGGRSGLHDDWLCQEVMRIEKDTRVVLQDFLVILILFLRLYRSTFTNIGRFTQSW